MSKFFYPGLTEKQVKLIEAEYGNNSLPPPKVESFFDKLLDNFDDPLIKILLVALLATLILAYSGYAEWIEGFGIAFAVFLATFVSTYSEYKNESSFQRLQEEASCIRSKVFRSGNLASIQIGNIVQGDHILVQSGDKVPVDGHIIEGELWVAQQALTGEAHLLCKSTSPSDYKPASCQFNDKYTVFRESVVSDGEAVIVADYVGIHTQYGKIAAELANTDERESPLQVKLAHLANNISTLGYIGALLISCSFLFKQIVMDQQFDMDRIIEYLVNWPIAFKDAITALILAIIIIVVAVPEGLPMMIAIVLSLNMRKLLRAKVLVRKLLGIEAAGSLNLLFVDKTGTLTKGQLEAHMFVTGGLDVYKEVCEIPYGLQKILDFCIRFSSPSHLTSTGLVGGNATDRAFLGFVIKSETQIQDKITRGEVRREAELLFNSTCKFGMIELRLSSNVTQIAGNLQGTASPDCALRLSIIKGAPEIIIPNCAQYYMPDGSVLPLESTDAIMSNISVISSSGVRMVALATSHFSVDPFVRELPSSMTLIGVMGIYDQIREETHQSIQTFKQASIQVVMVTGDLEETAVAVAQQIGLLPSPDYTKDQNEALYYPTSLTSKDLNAMSDEQVMDILPHLRVVARAYPTDKSRLVRLAQRLDLVVGMTGDGVNDASALKSSDVGFGMGSGTEVAKEASDIIIMDDNFCSISMAILYGRTIFKSIRKFIVFQSTINVASTLIVFLGPFLGFDFPLTLIQLLWVNLVMDTLAALAFGGEPALPCYMQEVPIQRDESIISPDMWSSILINGTFVALLSSAFLLNSRIMGMFVRDGIPSEAAFLTAFFAFFIFINILNALNVRTPKISLLQDISSNLGFVFVIISIFVVQVVFSYIGGRLLRTIPLAFGEWMQILLMSSIILPFDMLRKVIISPALPKSIKEVPCVDPQNLDSYQNSGLVQLQPLEEQPDNKKNK